MVTNTKKSFSISGCFLPIWPGVLSWKSITAISEREIQNFCQWRLFYDIHKTVHWYYVGSTWMLSNLYYFIVSEKVLFMTNLTVIDFFCKKKKVIKVKNGVKRLRHFMSHFRPTSGRQAPTWLVAVAMQVLLCWMGWYMRVGAQMVPAVWVASKDTTLAETYGRRSAPCIHAG